MCTMYWGAMVKISLLASLPNEFYLVSTITSNPGLYLDYLHNIQVRLSPQYSSKIISTIFNIQYFPVKWDCLGKQKNWFHLSHLSEVFFAKFNIVTGQR